MRPVLYAALAGAIAAWEPHISAQQAPQPLPDMQMVADSLGVTCDYCHARGPGAAKGTAPGATAPGLSHIAVAKQMIAMTRDLNATVETATGKATGAPTKVECVTCHRGVPIPKQLGDLLAETTVKQGIDAAVAQYRDLRTRFYGKQAYDFSEPTLINLSRRLANSRADDAIAIAKLNVEFYPSSAPSYVALAYAYTRKVDDPHAIEALEKAVELDPSNSVARGQLEQLKSYQRRR